MGALGGWDDFIGGFLSASSCAPLYPSTTTCVMSSGDMYSRHISAMHQNALARQLDQMQQQSQGAFNPGPFSAQGQKQRGETPEPRQSLSQVAEALKPSPNYRWLQSRIKEVRQWGREQLV